MQQALNSGKGVLYNKTASKSTFRIDRNKTGFNFVDLGPSYIMLVLDTTFHIYIWKAYQAGFRDLFDIL